MQPSVGQGLMFGGVAAFLAALMTMMTPKYIESIKEGVRLGLYNLLLSLLGLLMFTAGIYMEFLRHG